MPLHANWHNSSLYVWGDPDGAGQPMPADALRAAVAELAQDALLVAVSQPDELRLWLPDAAGSLSATTVPALRFPPAEAIDLLVACRGDGCDDTIRHWGCLARYVMGRIAAQQFFPDIVRNDDAVPRAVWRVLAGPADEIERLERFAAAMPPAARAVVGGVSEAAELVESFLSTSVDAVIRRDVSHDPFFLRVHELASAPDATPEVRWMSALLGDDRTIHGDPYDTAALIAQVRAWVGRLDESAADAPWKLSFTLEEPDSDPGDPPADQAAAGDGDPDKTQVDNTGADAANPQHDGSAEQNSDVSAADPVWRVEIRLLPPEDDAAPMDVAELFLERGDGTTGGGGVMGRKVAARRAQVLADLAAASEVFPPLQTALTLAAASGDAPAVVELTTPEAHLFIRQWAVPLRERGFAVTLPDWAERRESIPGLLLSVRPDDAVFLGNSGPSAGGGNGAPSAEIAATKFGLDSLLSFDWQIAVGDLRFSPAEFRAIVEQKLPLIRHRGRWLEIDTEAADRAAQFLSQKPAGQMTLAEAFRTAFAVTTTDSGVPIVGLSGTSWVGQLLDQAPGAQVEKIEQPPGFLGTLRPYQLRGLDWLSFLNRLGIGGCLADDMGLGKTIQLIALLLHERQPPTSVGPTLLFAPTSVVGNWMRELARFAPSLKVLVHHGPDRVRGDAFVEAAARHDVVVTSYALAHRDVPDLRRPRWHRIALDEAQKIKNPYAASTLAIRALGAPNRVALTGTPIENRLAELWSIMEVLNPGLLGSPSEFRDRFAMPIEKLLDQDRAQQLRKLIQPFVLRRTKSDPQVAGDLPEKMEMKVYCNLTPEQAALYQRITGEMLGQVDAADGIRRRALVLAALTRLKQVCDHPALLLKDDEPLAGRSGKCERLVEMLEEVLEEGDAALVFTQFREMGHLLERTLAERLNVPIQFLHGGTPAKGRDAMIERFQKPNSDVRIFILSLRAGGLGLNLTAANHVFHFDRWWNPAVESQATDRAHRIGQTRTVQVHKYVCIGTVEERIDQLLSEKVALADRIVGSGDEWLTGLSTDQLRKALELSSGAVAEY
jgi:superfamily II DNA or RNA helicase